MRTSSWALSPARHHPPYRKERHHAYRQLGLSPHSPARTPSRKERHHAYRQLGLSPNPSSHVTVAQSGTLRTSRGLTIRWSGILSAAKCARHIRTAATWHRAPQPLMALRPLVVLIICT